MLPSRDSRLGSRVSPMRCQSALALGTVIRPRFASSINLGELVANIGCGSELVYLNADTAGARSRDKDLLPGKNKARNSLHMRSIVTCNSGRQARTKVFSFIRHL